VSACASQSRKVDVGIDDDENITILRHGLVGLEREAGGAGHVYARQELGQV